MAGDYSEDLISEADQATGCAKLEASIVSAFYIKLIREKVDVQTARILTVKYYERISRDP